MFEQRRAPHLRQARQLLGFTAALIGIACSVGCGAPTTTQRVVAGRTLEGRYIEPEAYAAVLRAELLAQQGLTTQAYEAYREASDAAGYSPEVWTRLGAIACKLGLADHTAAFAKAAARDPDYEPLWRERAECALNRGDLQAALQAAERATALDPNQRRNTELAALALSRLNRAAASADWQHAFALRDLREISVVSAAPGDSSEASALDRALRAEDLRQARRHALRLRVDPTALALRALQLGLPRIAMEQAQLVLSANPLDADARVAALCAADLLHDAQRFQALLVTPATSAPLRHDAEIELSRLLARRASLDSDARETAPPKP